MHLIHVPVSFGELLDKITILELKSERISDQAKLDNIERELASLQAAWTHPGKAPFFRELKAVNERLWEIEDAIREKERRQEFDEEFVQLARSVYFENDERSRIKRKVNEALGSVFIEEKSYARY
jgi:uncharacterized protein YukE